MFVAGRVSSTQSSGQLSYTCCVISAAEAFGENRNSFVFPDTSINRKLILSAGICLEPIICVAVVCRIGLYRCIGQVNLYLHIPLKEAGSAFFIIDPVVSTKTLTLAWSNWSQSTSKPRTETSLLHSTVRLEKSIVLGLKEANYGPRVVYQLTIMSLLSMSI